MKRNLLALSIMALALCALAKDPKPCPSGYYDSAVNKSDQALLTALYNIITDHTDIGYDGLWDAYADTDTDPNGYYIDMYSTYDRYTYSDKCGNYSAIGDCINREHSVPKSWWGGSKIDPYSDIFNIVPTDGYVNNQRSNYPYGVCEGGTRLSNGNYVAKGRMGYSTRDGYTGRVFEPDDEYKGDFARAYFYMAACYNNIVSNWTKSGGDAFFAGNSYPVFTTYAIDLLIEWHRLDPVSEKEIKRNNYAYSWQDNRNPFIDHPELAEHIWGNKQGQAWTGDGSSSSNTPTLVQPAAGSTIAVGTIAATGTSVSTTVTVKGINLTKSITVGISGSGFDVTPTTLTASAVNNGTTITITYSGEQSQATGTLTLSSTEVSRSISLTAGKESTTPVEPDPTPSGETVIEDWEGCQSGGYWTQAVQGAAFEWYFTDASIYAQSNDHWNGNLGCRFGKSSTSSIAMQEDVAGTSGISFYAANYGYSEGTATMQVLYSTDGGSSWTLLKELSLTYEFTQYSYGLEIDGNVRFKFQQTAGKRMNIDDIAIYAPVKKEPKVYFDGAVEALSAIQNEPSTISQVTVITEDNDDAVTVSVDDNFELSLDQQTWAASLALDASGETFYVRLADTSTVGTFEGTITAQVGTVVAYADVEGEVTAPAVLKGDVNDDGVVNITDVIVLISYVTGNEVNPFNPLAADMNEDGGVNITDVTLLISMVLNDDRSMAWKALPSHGSIVIDNPAEETLEVYDLEANLVATVNGSQAIDVPSGIYLVTSDSRSHKVVVK